MSVQEKLEQLRKDILWQEQQERQRNWNAGKKRTFNGVVYATKKELRLARATHRAEKSFGKEPKHGRKKEDREAA